MSRRRADQTGLTLIEILMVAAMVSTIAVVVSLFLSKNVAFFKRMSARQQIMTDSRICMDTITQYLRLGNSKTLVFSNTGSGFSSDPYSRVDFDFISALPSGATAFAIFLNNDTAYTQEFVPAAGGARTPRPLAKNVVGLNFTGDSRDSTYVGVTLRMEVPWDSSNKPNRSSMIIVPERTVHMGTTP